MAATILSFEFASASEEEPREIQPIVKRMVKAYEKWVVGKTLHV
jgi:hypothetical protein